MEVELDLWSSRSNDPVDHILADVDCLADVVVADVDVDEFMLACSSSSADNSGVNGPDQDDFEQNLHNHQLHHTNLSHHHHHHDLNHHRDDLTSSMLHQAYDQHHQNHQLSSHHQLHLDGQQHHQHQHQHQHQHMNMNINMNLNLNSMFDSDQHRNTPSVVSIGASHFGGDETSNQQASQLFLKTNDDHQHQHQQQQQQIQNHQTIESQYGPNVSYSSSTDLPNQQSAIDSNLNSLVIESHNQDGNGFISQQQQHLNPFLSNDQQSNQQQISTSQSSSSSLVASRIDHCYITTTNGQQTEKGDSQLCLNQLRQVGGMNVSPSSLPDREQLQMLLESRPQPISCLLGESPLIAAINTKSQTPLTQTKSAKRRQSQASNSKRSKQTMMIDKAGSKSASENQPARKINVIVGPQITSKSTVNNATTTNKKPTTETSEMVTSSGANRSIQQIVGLQSTDMEASSKATTIKFKKGQSFCKKEKQDEELAPCGQISPTPSSTSSSSGVSSLSATSSLSSSPKHSVDEASSVGDDCAPQSSSSSSIATNATINSAEAPTTAARKRRPARTNKKQPQIAANPTTTASSQAMKTMTMSGGENNGLEGIRDANSDNNRVDVNPKLDNARRRADLEASKYFIDAA